MFWYSKAEWLAPAAGLAVEAAEDELPAKRRRTQIPAARQVALFPAQFRGYKPEYEEEMKQEVMQEEVEMKKENEEEVKQEEEEERHTELLADLTAGAMDLSVGAMDLSELAPTSLDLQLGSQEEVITTGEELEQERPIMHSIESLLA
jgi:hypothetical protein